ncbi:hypothetical protein EPI10_022114 [Gossypium australe]|uniref:Mitochondrial protein n=1 Tax=Gossypium australe TaxID=47621 RepID=A0A5B6WL59_9ROSI|nr:hypothetical protein EPI10_022114 [Gossypium australe]
MAIDNKIAKDDGNALSNPQHYRSIVWSLQYLCHKRPDISYSVNKRILRYLRSTLDYGLIFTSGTMVNLIAYTDADWRSNADDRRSTSGHYIFLGPNIISWSSKKQRFVSRSTVEAEYRSLADTAS